MPPGPVCPACLSADQVWQVMSGRGTLDSWADFHRAYWLGFRNDLPYRVAVVRLEEGPVLVSMLVDPGGVATLGGAVEVVFNEVTPEITLPLFKVLTRIIHQGGPGALVA